MGAEGRNSALRGRWWVCVGAHNVRPYGPGAQDGDAAGVLGQMLENRSIYRSLGKKSIKTNKEGAPFL